jgi:hypothetical protein
MHMSRLMTYSSEVKKRGAIKLEVGGRWER